MGYTAFQANCIQRNAAQIWDGSSAPVVVEEHYSGGYPVPKAKKFDSEAYAYAYNNADYLRRRQRVDSLPVEAKEAVLEAVTIDNAAEREQALNDRLKGIDAKFRAQYAALMESYYDVLLDIQLKIQLRKDWEMLQNQNAAILLLLT